MNNAKRKPNWTLCVKPESAEKWRNIGAAWETEKGNLFLKLDEGETLRGTAMLFPYREKEERRPRYAPRRPPRELRELPPIKDAATLVKEHESVDYMEWKRQQRLKGSSGPAPTAPPTPQSDDCPDPEAPDWL